MLALLVLDLGIRVFCCCGNFVLGFWVYRIGAFFSQLLDGFIKLSLEGLQVSFGLALMGFTVSSGF